MSVAPLGTAMTDPLTAVLERTPPMTSSGRCWTVQLLPDEPPMILQVPIFVPFLVAAQELIGGWMERVRPDVPAHAGVSPPRWWPPCAPVRRPRARGGEPPPESRSKTIRATSPRTRG